ncbi:MAG: hypothetical protein LBC29_03890, partial [Propionibacteriaceae bacterium]|nr:hypothetical protein [Propionibacteriaceae bacterium]
MPTDIETVTLDGAIDSESVLNTEGTEVYSYTLDSSGQLTKVRLSDGEPIWHVSVGTSGIQLGSPALIPESVSTTYAGVYVPATNYYGMLLNQYFDTDISDWETSNPTGQPPVVWVDEDVHAALAEGDAMWQDLNYTAATGTKSAQLFSEALLQTGSVNPAEVLYTITNTATQEVIMDYTISPNSTSVWTEFSEYRDLTLTQNTTYRVQATVITGNVYIHDIGFGWQTGGVSKVSLDGGT